MAEFIPESRREAFSRPLWSARHPAALSDSYHDFFGDGWKDGVDAVVQEGKLVNLYHGLSFQGAAVPPWMIYAYHHKLSHKMGDKALIHLSERDMRQNPRQFLDLVDDGPLAHTGHQLMILNEEGRPLVAIIDRFFLACFTVDENSLAKFHENMQKDIFRKGRAPFDPHVRPKRRLDGISEAVLKNFWEAFAHPERFRKMFPITVNDAQNKQILDSVMGRFIRLGDASLITAEDYESVCSRLCIDLHTNIARLQPVHEPAHKAGQSFDAPAA